MTSGARESGAPVAAAPLAPPTARSASVALEPRVAIALIGGVAEERGGDARALEEEADVQLVGDADAAVHLHRLGGAQREGVGGARLGGAGELRHVVAPLVDGDERFAHHRAQELDLAEQPRRAMLQRLER